MSNLLCIGGVRGYEENGVAHLHIEDVARGLGFERTELKNDVEYKSIRWERVEGFLDELNFRPLVGENGNPHDYFIPENIFYRLCMKAKNDVAEAFQTRVADEIIPSIRRTGSYSIQPTQPALPQSYLEALKALVASEEAKEAAQKALEAEKEQHEADNRDFCEGLAILESKKAEIGSRREAKAMSKAAVAVKQCKKLESRVADLEDELGRGRNWMYINLLKDRWIKRFGHKPDWRLLKAYCDQIGIAPIKDVEGVFVDAKGGQHPTKMYRYPIAAWKMYYEWEMSLMQSLS